MTELLSRLIEAVTFNTKRIAEHEEYLKRLIEYTTVLGKLVTEMKKPNPHKWKTKTRCTGENSHLTIMGTLNVFRTKKEFLSSVQNRDTFSQKMCFMTTKNGFLTAHLSGKT